MKIIISKCVENKFGDYVKWYMKMLNKFLPLIIVCKFKTFEYERVSLQKYFQTNIYQMVKKVIRVILWIKHFLSTSKRENWTNDTQMCCWKFISNFCVYFSNPILCAVYRHLEYALCRKFLQLDPFSEFYHM